MSENSKIEWTDATWNPVRGCAKVSPGCLHCYAETFAERFRGVPGHPFEFGFDLRIVQEKLADPLRWSKPKKIFVNSMSDLFHEDVSDEYIEKICRVMLAAHWHTYQILTKRANRMAALLQGKLREAAKAGHICSAHEGPWPGFTENANAGGRDQREGNPGVEGVHPFSRGCSPHAVGGER
jgi:protein gp37